MHPHPPCFPSSVNGGESQYDLLAAARTAKLEFGQPYLSGSTGRLLMDSLENSGFTLKNEIVREMEMQADVPIYGNFSMQYGRFLGKLVNYPYHAEKIFDQQDDMFQADVEFEPTGNEVVDHYNYVLAQVIHRETHGVTSESNIIESHREMSVNVGSCTDAESRFVVSYVNDDLDYERNGDVHFLRKTVGDHTLINVQPVVYKGILLPPGWIFRRDPYVINAIYPLRVSSFMFSTDIAKEAFQGSMRKTDPESYETVRQLFADTVAEYAKLKV